MPSSINPLVIEPFSLPEETRIYHSKGRPIFLALVLLVWLAAAIALLILKIYLAGSILLILVFAGLLITYKVFADRTAQLIIGRFGITTIADGFHPWADITGEEVVKYGHGRQRSYYLVYHHPAGTAKLDIGWLKISQRELQVLLEYYRNTAAK